MPRVTARILFLIACITGLAIAAVSVGHAKRAADTEKTREKTAAQCTAAQMCPVVHPPMCRPLTAFKSGYPPLTPVSSGRSISVNSASGQCGPDRLTRIAANTGF